MSPAFYIQEHDGISHDEILSRVHIEQWWKPSGASPLFALAVVILPLFFIIGLEILQRQSNRHDGLFALHISHQYATTSVTTIPTLIMGLVKLIYQSLNFVIEMFAPFAFLLNQNRSAHQSCMRYTTGQMPIVNLFRSVESGQLAVMFIFLAVILRSFLSVLTSGLYTVQNVNNLQNVNLQAVDSFNLTSQYVSNFLDINDNGAADVFSFQDDFNTSYSPLSFSLHSDIIRQSQVSSGSDYKLNVSIPAIRASLNCTFAQMGTLRVLDAYPERETTDLSYDIELPQSRLGERNSSYSN